MDDNRDAADSLGELPGVPGCECAVFYDGRQALDSLEQSAPAAAFVDLDMPGIDGCQFAQQIRAHARLHDLHLVALTGWAQAGDALRTAQAGFDRHLVKPVSLEQPAAALTVARAHRSRRTGARSPRPAGRVRARAAPAQPLRLNTEPRRFLEIP